MPLAKRWKPLERSTVTSAPSQYGVYELGDEDGTVQEVGWGVLADELKEALLYANVSQVRWEAAASKDHARELAAEHENRRA